MVLDFVGVVISVFVSLVIIIFGGMMDFFLGLKLNR